MAFRLAMTVGLAAMGLHDQRHATSNTSLQNCACPAFHFWCSAHKTHALRHPEPQLAAVPAPQQGAQRVFPRKTSWHATCFDGLSSIFLHFRNTT